MVDDHTPLIRSECANVGKRMCLGIATLVVVVALSMFGMFWLGGRKISQAPQVLESPYITSEDGRIFVAVIEYLHKEKLFATCAIDDFTVTLNATDFRDHRPNPAWHPEISDDLIKELWPLLLKANLQRYEIRQVDLATTLSVQVASHQDNDRLSHRDGAGNEVVFVQVSKPVASKHENAALVYYTVRRHPMDGGSGFLWLRRIERKWKVVGFVPLGFS